MSIRRRRTMTTKNGWSRLCGDCWQERHPDEYLTSDSVDFDFCANCGARALVYGTRADYFVTFIVPLTIRIENVDSSLQAEDVATEAYTKLDLDFLIDPSDFSILTDAPQDTEVIDSHPSEHNDHIGISIERLT